MREVEEEKDEDDCGDTPAGRLTQSLLMQTVPQRATASRRRQDSREYRCVCVRVRACACCFAFIMCIMSYLLRFQFDATVFSRTEFCSFFFFFLSPGSNDTLIILLLDNPLTLDSKVEC